jgi:hypothetical protein
MAPHVHTLIDHVLCRGSIVDVSWAVVQRSQGVLYLLGANRLTDRVDTQAFLMAAIGLLP